MRPIVITGATGTLGRAFERLARRRGLAYRATRREALDIADAHGVEALLDRLEPWAVVNTAGYVRVDDAEADWERCYRENTRGAEVLAAACAARGVKLLTFSSDLVFDGAKAAPYDEADAPAPLSAYGRSKAEAEARVLDAWPEALVVRTSAFFGPWDEHNFVTTTLRRLAAGASVTAAEDAVVSPTYVPDLVHACLDLLVDGEGGLWHLSNHGEITWLELAREAARVCRVDEARLVGRPVAHLGHRAPRPPYSALASARGRLLPPLSQALARYARERAAYEGGVHG